MLLLKERLVLTVRTVINHLHVISAPKVGDVHWPKCINICMLMADYLSRCVLMGDARVSERALLTFALAKVPFQML